jgi:hypothetical protein
MEGSGMKLVGKTATQAKTTEWVVTLGLSGLLLLGVWIFVPHLFWFAIYMQVLTIVFKIVFAKFLPQRPAVQTFGFRLANLRFTSQEAFTEKSISYGMEEVLPHNGIFFYLKFQAVNDGNELASLPSNVTICNMVESYPILEWLVIKDQTPVYEQPSKNALVHLAVNFLNDGAPEPTPDFSNHINPNSSKIVQARFDVPVHAVKPGSGYVLRFGDITVYRF